MGIGGQYRIQLTSRTADFQNSQALRLYCNRVLAFGGRSAEAYAHVVPAANAAGNPIDFTDAVIGAIGLEANFMLATRKARDFKGTSVKLPNPWS